MGNAGAPSWVGWACGRRERNTQQRIASPVDGRGPQMNARTAFQGYRHISKSSPLWTTLGGVLLLASAVQEGVISVEQRSSVLREMARRTGSLQRRVSSSGAYPSLCLEGPSHAPFALRVYISPCPRCEKSVALISGDQVASKAWGLSLAKASFGLGKPECWWVYNIVQGDPSVLCTVRCCA